MNQRQKLARLEIEVSVLKSGMAKFLQANGIRQDGDGTNVAGVIQTHPHQATGEGGDVTYLPTVFADWENFVAPGGMQGALDQLAERIQDLDSLLVPSVTMEMTGMESSSIGTSTHTFKIVTKTANYTATDADTVILCDASSASFTVTLPPAADRTGKVFEIKKTDSTANTVTIDGDSSETIDGGLTAVITSQYESITVVSDGSAWFIL